MEKVYYWAYYWNIEKIKKPQVNQSLGVLCGGGAGIRTLGTLRYVGFQDRCFRPLSHPSEKYFWWLRLQKLLEFTMRPSCRFNKYTFLLKYICDKSFHLSKRVRLKKCGDYTVVLLLHKAVVQGIIPACFI